MEEIIRLDDNSLENKSHETKKISIIRQDASDEGFDPTLLGKILPYLNLADMIQKVEAGVQYVVEVPIEYQNAFKKGELKMMENKKSKKHWANLVKVEANGKNTIVAPLPVKEEMVFQGNLLQELSEQYAQIQMNQKLQEISEQLEEICNIGKKVLNGQTDDRIAKLESGKNLIALALTMPEGADRTIQIGNARQDIANALNAIKEVLKRQLSEFEPISSKKIKRIMREIGKSGYHRGKLQEFYEIQDYFDLFLKSTKILAASYAYFGFLPAAEAVYKQSTDFLKTLDFSKVKTIVNIQSKNHQYFFKHPEGYFKYEKNCLLDEMHGEEFIGIEVSGEKLLEVINDGKSENF